jgi:hypothetical protein
VPARYLLSDGAVVVWASQDQNTPLMKWAVIVGSSEIQTSVMALTIGRARVDHEHQGRERQLWIHSLDQLEHDMAIHAGPPLAVDRLVAHEWAGLRYAPLQSITDSGSPKDTSQDVRLMDIPVQRALRRAIQLTLGSYANTASCRHR